MRSLRCTRNGIEPRALALVARLNTLAARESGYEELARSLVRRTSVDVASLVRAIREIKADLRRDRLTVEALMVLDAATTAKRSCIDVALLELWSAIEFASYKFQALGICLCHAVRAGNTVRAKELTPILEEVWQSIFDEATKVELGYMICSRLSEDDISLAKMWMAKTETLESLKSLTSDSVKDLGYSTLDMCAKLYASVAPKASSLAQDPTFGRLSVLIEMVPAIELRTRLWADLAVWMHFQENTVGCQFICDRYLSKVLELNNLHNISYIDHLVADAAPALFFAHQSSALHRISSMRSVSQQDQARQDIVTCILQRTSRRDPYKGGNDPSYTLFPKDISDILALLEDMKFDSFIFGITEDLCRSLVSEQNKVRVSRNAAIDFLVRIEKIVEGSLPDIRNIQHLGYKIACKASINRARDLVLGRSKQVSTSIWEGLYKDARGIGNVADRAIVTALVGSHAKFKAESVLSNWRAELRNDLRQIPAAIDRLERYEWVARIVDASDRAEARSIIKESLTITLESDIDSLSKIQRKLLDLAYSIDPAFSKELMSRLDTDQARQKTISQRFKENDTRKTLGTQPSSIELDHLSDEEVSNACAENIASLNAGRINTHPLEDFASLIRRSASMAPRVSNAAWQWFVINALAKRGPNKQTEPVCSHLLDAALRSVEIIFGLVGKIGVAPLTLGSTGGTLGTGDRDQFIQVMKEWSASLGDCVVRISDPYFGLEDIQLIRVMSQAGPNLSFRIATSREKIKKLQLTTPDEDFLAAWQDLADIDPPNITIAVVGYAPDGKHPIHDRWIVAGTSGWRLGTSLNAIGVSRISDLSSISNDDARSKGQQIEDFFTNAPRDFNGHRLSVSTFTI